MCLREQAQKLKTDIPAVFIAMNKKETPKVAKIIAGITIAYALSPIDLIPDFIPILGYLDDLLILPSLAALAIRLIPPEVFDECRKEADGLWVGGKQKKWNYALPIVLLWLLIIYLFVKSIWY